MCIFIAGCTQNDTVSNQGEQASNPVPMNEIAHGASASAIPKMDSSVRTILRQSEAFINLLDDSVPNDGEIMMPFSLTQGVLDPANADALFAVSISIYGVTSFWEDTRESFLYEGKTIKELQADPAITLHDREAAKWYEAVFRVVEIDMTRRELAGDKSLEVMRWVKDSDMVRAEMFAEYWQKTQPMETQNTYDTACQRLTKAINAVDAYLSSEEYLRLEMQESKNRYEDEIARLRKLDITLDVDESELSLSYRFPYLYGLLTAEQIQEFPANQKYGYIIKWDTRTGDHQDDNGIDE